MSVKMPRKTFFVLLILALFLFGLCLHHHGHQEEGAHCPVCLIVQDGFVVIAAALSAPLILLVGLAPPLDKGNPLPSLARLSNDNRAPPSLSLYQGRICLFEVLS